MGESDAPDPLLRVDLDRSESVARDTMLGDRIARRHYGARRHRRLGVAHLPDQTIRIFYAQENPL